MKQESITETIPTQSVFEETPGSFEFLKKRTESRFEAATTGDVIFKTDVEDLFSIYLDSFSDDARQFYHCHACKHFLNTYGSLVSIRETGETAPVMWSSINYEEFFQGTREALYNVVKKAKVVSPFYAKNNKWEANHDGSHIHFAITAPSKFVKTDPFQFMAAKKEDFNILSRSLAGLKEKTVSTAITVLESFQSERVNQKFLPVAKLFHTLILDLQKTKNRTLKDNLKWRYVGMSNPGNCHIRTGVIGTILDVISTYHIDRFESL